MHYKILADAATAFLDRLPDISSNLQVKDAKPCPDAGQFRDIFRKVVPPRGGVYWFFLPDGTVFDIGKANGNVWKRVYDQAGTAVWHGDPKANYPETVGEGWGFPNSDHLAGGAARDVTIESVRAGTFHVGWVTFEPGYCSTLVEVYLQTLCRATDGELPEFCRRIG